MITRNRADFTKQEVGSEELSLRLSASSVQMALCLQSGRRVYAIVVARRLGQSQRYGPKVSLRTNRPGAGNRSPAIKFQRSRFRQSAQRLCKRNCGGGANHKLQTQVAGYHVGESDWTLFDLAFIMPTENYIQTRGLRAHPKR